MAKTLHTTVHLRDEKGETHQFNPDDKLPRWAVTQLNKSWGDRDDLWSGSADADEPESVEEHLEAGHPPPSSGGEAGSDPVLDDAEKVAQEQRDREAAEAQERAGVADDDAAEKPRARRR